ncbi:hypothetical protein ABH931_002663 [Streptacidiphilus sp. MAP12-33]|uniref:hypothetical protein n=1 Tax=Streptacidiphilus sp. MAP12-33 TaxID=3156266 RepID=UPI00351985E0
MSGTEPSPRRRERPFQRAKVGPNATNIMAGRDVQATEINNYHGPNSGPRRAIGWKGLVLVFVGVFVVSTVSLQVVLWGSNGHGAGSSVGAGRGGTASADGAGPPFATQVSYPGDPVDPIPSYMNWAVVLDRVLTPSEVAGLERINGGDGQAVWEYLRPLGGRFASVNWQTGPRVTFRMVFLSDRSSPVSIQSMRPVQIGCHDTTAKTLINFVNEGDDAVPTVAFSVLTPDDPVDAVDDQGNSTVPYFRDHQIDLGPGMTPGALDVKVTGEAGKVCAWRFAVGYATAKGQYTETIGDGGRPLTMEAAPLQPVQHIEYGLDPAGHPRWADCATDSNCG